MQEFDDVSEKTRVTDAVAIKPAESAQDVLVLIYPAGPNLGRKYELKGKVITMGRDPTSDILVSSDSVSRRHARLSMEDGRRILTDLESTNGSYIADQPIISQVLRNGDQVKIGDTIFKYLVGSDIEASYHEEIYRLTTVDGLTQTYNRRYLDEQLSRELARSHRYNRPLSLVIFDVDSFSRVNEDFGHLAGDALLAQLAGLVKRNIRREDVIARSSGEEFAFILPETDAKHSRNFAEKIRRLVEASTFTFEGTQLRCTVSLGIGAAQGPTAQVSNEEFMKVAQDNLAVAKRLGRNRVVG